ncbi:MAG: hypothetical protein ACREAD_04210 [Nitrosopumilaceae archaeon]
MANVNPTAIDELEEKKWLISRIDLYHKTTIDVLQNDIRKYESVFEKAISDYKINRNFILSGLGIVLSIIVGIIPNPLNQWFFFIIPLVFGIASLIIIILYYFLIKIAESVLAPFTQIYTNNIAILLQSQSFIITRATRLSAITLHSVSNYHVFTMLLTISISVSSEKTLKQFARKYSKVHVIKTAFLREAKSYQIDTKFIPTYYQQLDRSEYVLKELLEFVDKTLAEYNPKN